MPANRRPGKEPDALAAETQADNEPRLPLPLSPHPILKTLKTRREGEAGRQTRHAGTA